MRKITVRFTLFGLLSALLVMSCGLLAPTPQPESGAIYTQAAQTVSVQLTQQAFSTLVAQLTQMASSYTATPGSAPVQVTPLPATSTPTLQPTQPVAFSPTPPPPTATTRPVRCNQAEFVKDVTIADGTVFSPGAEFTKIWRLQNTGSCTWDSNYSLVFESGDRLNGDKKLALGGTVRPGESIDVAVDLIAPSGQGRYRGYWMLANASGERFGIGKQADVAFWVEIKIQAPNTSFAYDFAVNMCTATWRSSAGSLTCPSSTGSDAGSVALLTAPDLEDGRTENESTLWTRPQTNRGGWISGVYPAYKVKDGDHFLAEVGCLEGNSGCGVTFTLDYIQANGRMKNIGEWYEAYDGKITRIDVNLSFLAGDTVQFVLGVINEDKPGKANAFWLVPSIRKVAAPTAVPPTKTPTATVTPTPTLVPTQGGTDPTPADNPAVTAARLRVASETGSNPAALLVMSVEAIQWQDTCLGMTIQDISCAAVITPGYRIIFASSDSMIEARTNQDGSIIYWFRP